MAGQQTNAPRVDGEEILDGIRQWVEIESPTYDGAAIEVVAGRSADARVKPMHEEFNFNSMRNRR